MSDKTGYLPNLILALLVLGASGIVAQTVLLRELLILFAGNELTLGIIFGAWVVCEAAGSFAAGRRFGFMPVHVSAFVFASILFSLLFPVAIFLARTYKPIAGIPVELGVGLGHVIGASFLVLLPIGFIHGFLFISACSMYNVMTGVGHAAAGKVYFWETVGSIIGGVAVSYLFIPYLDSFHSALLMALANGCACLALARGFREGKRLLPGAAAALFSLSVLLFLEWGGADRLQTASLAREWEGKNIVAYRNSFYQNIVVVRNEGQYTFFTDGIPLITTPVPDISYVEEFVHFPFLAHPSPATVLVLGRGAGGVIAEVLKYPSVQRVDYVESDPALLKAIRDFPTPLTLAELGNPRVRIHYGDPRLFLRKTPHRYDIVLLNIPLPQTLQANRLFTRECFTAVKGVMQQGGIFAVPVTGSLTYYNRELKTINASCLTTLAAVFPHRFIVPGDTNLILSAVTPDLDAVTPALLAARLAERGIETRLITPEHIAYRFDREKAAWLREVLRGSGAQVNRDFSPMGPYYNMVYSSLLFSPQMKGLFDLVGRVTLSATIAATVLLLLLVFFLARKHPVSTIPIVISGTGFSAMVFELLLFFGFQVLYGHVFYLVGVLTGTFMGGIAAGSLVVTALLPRVRNDRDFFLLIEGGIILFALLLTLLFTSFAASEISGSPLVYLLILFLLVAAGFLTGMEFPLAVRLQAGLNAAADLERSTGIIYGADLAGGFIGGLLGSAVLLPVLGFMNCCILVAVLKSGTLLIAAFAGKDQLLTSITGSGIISHHVTKT